MGVGSQEGYLLGNRRFGSIMMIMIHLVNRT